MLKLLHVEDDADIREIAKMALDMSGEFVVTQCANGEDALERIKTYTPDVILIDMMMPGMSGSQTLERIRENSVLAQTPVIFMTARAEHSEVEKLRSIGAAEVISKPFDPMALADQIKAAIKR